MGQAKLREKARAQQEEALNQVNIPALAAALRKLSQAASSHLGADCYTLSALGQEIFRLLGVEAKLVVGFAGWRVGNGDSDVILHKPTPETVPQPGGASYHVWLEIGHYLFDATLWTLREKARQLDEQDGGHTTVDWCPDYLFVKRETISSQRDVTQLHAGLYYYERDPQTEQLIVSTAPSLDLTDAEAAWTLYKNPDIYVLGPNDLKGPEK